MSVIMYPSHRYAPYSRVNRRCLHSDPFYGIFNDMMPWYGHDSYLGPASYVYKPRQVTVCPLRPTPIRTEGPWVHVLSLHGFEPSDVDVKVDGVNIVVQARRQIQQGNDCDIMEARRSVRVPDGVNKDEVRCLLHPNGDLVITAPYMNEARETRSKQCTIEPTPKRQKACTPLRLSDLISSFLNTRAENSGSIGADEKHTTVKRKGEDNKQECIAIRPLKKRMPVNMLVDKATDETDIEQEVPSIAEKSEAKNSKENMERTTTKLASSDSASVDRVDVDEEEQRLAETIEGPVAESRCSSPIPVENAENAKDKEMKHELSRPEAATEGAQQLVINAKATDLESFECNSHQVKDGCNKEFRVELDLSDFKPESISVKSDGQMLYIKGESQLEKDGLCILQELHRTYTLPEGALANAAKATMTERGTLCVTVPLCPSMEDVPALTLPQCA